MSPDTIPGQTEWKPNSELLVPQKFTYDWFREGINSRIPDKKQFAASVVGLGLTFVGLAYGSTRVAHAETTNDPPGSLVDTVSLSGSDPTLTPTRRPFVSTPEATATPMPIQFEAPVIIDAPMPSSTFTVHTSNVDDINLRRTPEIDPKNKIRLVKKNEKIYRTGKEVDGWVEMFLPTEGIFA